MWHLVAHQGVSGTVPSEIALLTSLQGLSFYDSTLLGTLPQEFFSLTDLTYLNLSKSCDEYNSVAISSMIGLLRGLSHLYWNESSLIGTLPTELGLLTGLTVLSLDKNSLTGPIPSELGHLTVLTKLNLHMNLWTGTLPSELGQMSSLSYLSATAGAAGGDSTSGTLPS